VPPLALDHLVVAAATLDEGRAFVRDRLGIRMAPGGRHGHMGTHNLLIGLGGRTYLEVIAVDPDAPAPSRSRWFALDDPAVRAQLDERPRLIAWVARTPDLSATVAAPPVDPGPVADMARGDFRWRMAVRDDGALLEGGCVPLVIQWPPGVHPADGMEDSGCRLGAFDLIHPAPEALAAILAGMGAAGLASLEHGPQPALRAELILPDGTAGVLD
jgi:hypothetical protein